MIKSVANGPVGPQGDPNVPDEADLVGSNGIDFTLVTVGDGLDLTTGTLSAPALAAGDGISGEFETVDGFIITVVDGVITDISPV